MKRVYRLLLFAALVLGFAGTPARAQTTLLQADYQNNPVFHVLSDGTVYMPIGATNGYVLTTDGAGNATWQPVSTGGLSAVTSDATLTGDGTMGDPLGVAVPLVLTGSDDAGLVQSTHTIGTFGQLSSSAWGVFGLYPNGNRGWLGSEDYGVFGVHDAGHGGYLGSEDYGAYGEHDNGNRGYLGTSSRGVYAENSNGQRGLLAGNLYGAYGEYDNTNYGFLGAEDYGTYGENFHGPWGALGSDFHGVYGEHDNGNYGSLGGFDWGVFGGHGTGGHWGFLGSDNFGAVGVYDNIALGFLGGIFNGSIYGTFGTFNENWGALGTNNRGAYAENANGHRGLLAGNSYGAYGEHANGPWGALGTDDHAGYFSGDVAVTGTLTKAGGSFKIDHPLDPENRYLSHSFVESPDMKNVYDGTVTLDARGQAVVELPAYFEALNRDFRYQLTCIGGFAPVYVAQKIANNRFTIAGGQPGMEVSWQVTGIRQDPWANENRIVVEEAKPAQERGFYLHPGLYGQPAERGVLWGRDPEGMRTLQERPTQIDSVRQLMNAAPEGMKTERRQIEQERQQMRAERERIQTEHKQRQPRPDNQR